MLDLQGRIRVWCESMAAFKAMGGAEKIKSAAAKLGIYPVSMEACLENLAKRTRAPAAEAAVAGGDLSLLAAATLCAAGMKRRRVSDITEAATAQLDDGPTDDDEAEGDGEDGRQAKKSRRVNYPMGAWSGSQMEAALAYKAAAAKAAEDEKVAKRAARAEKAAENAAHKAGAAERVSLRVTSSVARRAPRGARPRRARAQPAAAAPRAAHALPGRPTRAAARRAGPHAMSPPPAAPPRPAARFSCRSCCFQ